MGRNTATMRPSSNRTRSNESPARADTGAVGTIRGSLDANPMTAPSPEDRERVRALVESQWREPVTVVYLTEVRPTFRIPGRRYDGTVKGKRLIRRFFYNLLRGIVNVPVSAFLSAGSGQIAIFNFPLYDPAVEGPANAQALQLVDAVISAKTAWLAFSESHVAVVKDGQPLWHAARPFLPRHDLR